MLLAKVEQTDDRLVITPVKSVGGKPLLSVFLSVLAVPIIFLGECYVQFSASGPRLTFSKLVELCWFPIGFLLVGIVVFFVHRIASQWPEPEFVFDRATRKILRGGHFIGLFGNVMKVSLITHVTDYGLVAYRIALDMTNFDEWKVVETSMKYNTMAPSSNASPQPWVPYPHNRLPEDATEYELVMLANLIHSYLGLPEPAPSTHSVPLPSGTRNRMP